MRFIADGPSIPDRLLELRDDGQVVFLCGAGVSIPAGMPSFIRLTRDVLTHLRVPDDLPALRAFEPWEDASVPVSARTPLDQIFHSIRDEYGRDRINSVVAELLAMPAAAPAPREHSIVARLSTGPDGLPQIVTTNFDRLFEHPSVTSGLRVFEPPTFPDLRHNQPISGLTYLHGRLRTEDAQPHDYILSSADFGRAYLAEGWATRFVRLLLEKYTVVLLGYQADDPPVRYLLQGLNSTSALDEGRLYAFDRGAPEDVEAKWRDRGVTPIAYPGEGHDHSRLWDSLEAWASRADDPACWRRSIIDMARLGPRALQAHERGQVAHLVRTNLGAKAFADAEPVPPAEWLCVFDVGRRLADRERDLGAEDGFSPRDQHALDDDPPERPDDQPRHGRVGDDLIAWRPGDERPTTEFRLSGRTLRGFEELPPRLFHLCRWISLNSLDPVVAWWAAKQNRLHPRLSSMISGHIERDGDLPDLGRRIWNLIFEALDHSNENDLNMNWFATRRRIAHGGWTSANLRVLERCTEPFIKIDPFIGRGRAEPPRAAWSEIEQLDIAHFTVEFPNQRGAPLTVPDEAVCAVFSLASRNLIGGLDRLAEVGHGWYHTLTLYPDTSGPGQRYRSTSAEYVVWVGELMNRAAQINPVHVFNTISLWPSGECHILNKLRLFAWNRPAVFSGEQVAANLMSMDQEAFWYSGNRREFLFLIRDRWRDISEQEKERLFARLLAGRDPHSGEGTPDYPERRDHDVVSRLRWLEQHGCLFPGNAPERIAEVQARLPAWNDEWTTGAAASLEGRIGSVETVRDASELDGVPLSQVLETAREHTRRPFGEFRDYRPFDGLVRDHPGRALAVLGWAARRGEYPEESWGALVREWPDDAPARATRLFCERMRRLPVEVISANAHTVSSWIKARLPVIAGDDEAFALEVFDDLIDGLVAAGPEANKSGRGETSVGGRIIERSRRTIDHAINAPIGHSTEALISILNARGLPQGHGMPDEFATRFERLLAAPGEGPDHAITILTRQLRWLHHIAPDWVMGRTVPWFALNHPASEPAWNGLLCGSGIVGPDLFEVIKAPFLELFPRMYMWHWGEDIFRSAHEWLVMTTIWHQEESRYTSVEEAAAVIRRVSEDGRADIIRHLGRVGQGNDNGWTKLVIPFIRETWPREARYQTERASASFLSMLDDSGDAFPLVLEALRDYVRPIRQEHHSFYRFHSAVASDEDPITSRFPAETLELMDLIVPDNPREAPYDLGEVLTLISEERPDLMRDRRYLRLQELLAAR